MKEENLRKNENELQITKNSSNANKNGIIAILLIIVVALIVIVVYFAFIKKEDNLSNNNVNNNNQQNGNNQVVESKNADMYGTYYNSDYKDEYFKIDNDRTLVIVTSTCSEGMFPPKTVSYKVTRENDIVKLAIDINEDGTYQDTYTGSKNNGVYRFKPDAMGCTTDEYTYFITENDKVVGINSDIYGTYYNSDYKDEYFKIDNDRTLVIVTSTCSEGMFPPKTVPYKVTREDGKIMLAIDINEDGTYPDTYTGTKNNGVYRFKPNSYGCTTDEYTYFITENDKVVGINSDMYGTYYNSDYKDEYFKIDNDRTLVIVTSTCSEGMFPPKTVPYKVTREAGKIMLAIDINEDGTYPNTYTGTKNNGVYRFKPNSYGCTTDENTYFIKK